MSNFQIRRKVNYEKNFKILKALFGLIITLSLFSHYQVNAQIRACELASGAIFEYTGDELQDLRQALEEIKKTFNSKGDRVTSIEAACSEINQFLEKYSFSRKVCNNICAQNTILDLIFEYSSARLCFFDNEGKKNFIYSPNYKINNLRLSKSVHILSELIKNVKRCCICVSVDLVINSIKLTCGRNLEYEIDFCKNELLKNFKSYCDSIVIC